MHFVFTYGIDDIIALIVLVILLGCIAFLAILYFVNSIWTKIKKWWKKIKDPKGRK